MESIITDDLKMGALTNSDKPLIDQSIQASQCGQSFTTI